MAKDMMEDLLATLIQRREEAETELVKINQMIQIATDKPTPAKRTTSSKRRGGGGVKVSEGMQKRILDYVNENSGPDNPVTVGQVQNALKVSKGQAGRGLKVLSDTNQIVHAGRDETKRGNVPLYHALESKNEKPQGEIFSLAP